MKAKLADKATLAPRSFVYYLSGTHPFRAVVKGRLVLTMTGRGYAFSSHEQAAAAVANFGAQA